MKKAPVYGVHFEGDKLRFDRPMLGSDTGPAADAGEFLRRFVYNFKDQPNYNDIHAALMARSLSPSQMDWPRLYISLYEKPVQFSPNYETVADAFGLVLAALPPGLIRDPAFLLDKVYLISHHGLADPEKVLRTFLPPPEDWPRLTGPCGPELTWSDDDDVEHPDPMPTFARTLFRKIYELGATGRQNRTSNDLQYIQLIYNGNVGQSPLHEKHDGRVYLSSDPVWEARARAVIWGCTCSSRTLSASMLRRENLQLSDTPFDLNDFRGLPPSLNDTIKRHATETSEMFRVVNKAIASLEVSDDDIKAIWEEGQARHKAKAQPDPARKPTGKPWWVWLIIALLSPLFFLLKMIQALTRK